MISDIIRADRLRKISLNSTKKWSGYDFFLENKILFDQTIRRSWGGGRGEGSFLVYLCLPDNHHQQGLGRGWEADFVIEIGRNRSMSCGLPDVRTEAGMLLHTHFSTSEFSVRSVVHVSHSHVVGQRLEVLYCSLVLREKFNWSARR